MSYSQQPRGCFFTVYCICTHIKCVQALLSKRCYSRTPLLLLSLTMDRARVSRGGSWADYVEAETPQAAAAAGPRPPPVPPPANMLSPRSEAGSEQVPLGPIWKLFFLYNCWKGPIYLISSLM
jgi:hypothetical protein